MIQGGMNVPKDRKAQSKAYYEANKEKKLAQSKAYYEANKEKALAQRKAWYEVNKEKKHAYDKAWREANKEKVLAQQKAYQEANREKILEQRKAYREANKEKILAQSKAHYQNNKGYYATKANIRKGRIKAVNEIIDADDKWVLQEMYELAKLRTEVTGFAWDVDHIIPLSMGGKHSLDNLQVVPAVWNKRKSNRHSEKYFGATKEKQDGRNH